ncbi:MAG: serine hydrolase domain-containing protein [Chloroflexota bacterium]
MPRGTPASVAMDAAALARIDDLMVEAMEVEKFPGAVVVVARRGVIVKETAYGFAATHRSRGERLSPAVPATTNTLYDLASITKLYTLTAALTLVESGKLNLDAPLGRYVPEWSGGEKDKVTIRQLLTHTAGLPAGFHLWELEGSPLARLQVALSRPLEYAPGAKRLYSDCGPILVGMAIERITGLGLDRYVEEAVLRPLGLADTLYRPEGQPRQRVAATEAPPPPSQREAYWGVVHDGEARALGGVAGNAGLFATAADVALFAQAWLNAGMNGEASLLAADLATRVLQPLPVAGTKQALGWEINQRWYMGALAGSKSFGHTGYTGTSVVVDGQRQVVVVLLTNSVHPVSAGPINATRTALANIVAEAVK